MNAKLFFYLSFFLLEKLKNEKGIIFSKKFIDCAEYQLGIDFQKKTGIEPKMGKIAITLPPFEEFRHIKGEVSKLDIEVVVLAFATKAQICWKSKSGKNYDISDESIDENDIILWLEDLKPELYLKELYPKEPLPFKLKKLNYTLVVNRIVTDMYLEIYLQDTDEKLNQEIANKVFDIIEQWNLKTEKEDEPKEALGEPFFSRGVVHNSSIKINENNYLELYIDVGSADIIFLKKVLLELNKIDKVKKVVIE